MKGKTFFVTCDGSHAYHMNTPMSDFDLRVIHVMPMDELLAGKKARNKQVQKGKADIVWIEAGEFINELKKNNANAYIQLFSPMAKYPEEMAPLVNELRKIAMDNFSKAIQHSLLGIIHNTVVRGQQNKPKRRKLCLRQLRTIWHVMETGEWRFDPVKIKVTGAYLERMVVEFKEDMVKSSLPDAPPAPEVYDDFLVKLRKFVDANGHDLPGIIRRAFSKGNVERYWNPNECDNGAYDYDMAWFDLEDELEKAGFLPKEETKQESG